jgi:hypothetical protein
MKLVDFEIKKNNYYGHKNKKINAMPTDDPKHRQTCMICKKKFYESKMIVTDYVAMNSFRVWRLWKCQDCIRCV